MNLSNIYKQLTNVDIDQQRQLWNDRGKGYYGEFLVFCELYKNIPGNCKVLMNLEIPIDGERTTEIDLILIHETGIYIFEIKHYKGAIYGDATGNIWTQYFRTIKNNTFKNPILQNAYHISALRNIFREIPLKSVVVFTNNECNLRVKNYNSNVTLCTLYNLNRSLEYIFRNSEIIFSMVEIDEIFDKLSKYSKMQDTILYDGKEENFISWLQPTIQELKNEKNNLRNQIQQNKKNTITGIIINTFIIICFIIFNIFVINRMEANYNNQLEKFKQNFKHVDEIDNDYITALNEYFLVSDVSINELTSNAVTFNAKISKSNDVYGMALTKDSKYIVITSNGKVYEYNVFGTHLSYNRYNNMIGKGIRDYGNLYPAQFFGVVKNEIAYIKITNIELFKLDIQRTVIKQNLELELYSVESNW